MRKCFPITKPQIISLLNIIVCVFLYQQCPSPVYAQVQGACAVAPCDCRSVGGVFHQPEARWCNYQACYNQCMSEKGGGSSPGGAAAGLYQPFYNLGYSIGQSIGKALFGDPAEEQRRQMEAALRAQQEAQAAEIARQEAEAREAARRAEEARKRQEQYDRLSGQLQLSDNFDGQKAGGPVLMLGDGDDALRPQGTSFFGLGGGAGGSATGLNDSRVVDLRQSQGYSVATAAPASPGDTLPLIMGDPNVVDLSDKKTPYKGSEFFYAFQTRTLTPMKDGGHPIDAPGAPPVGLHGLVGGVAWTFGFQWPHKECDTKCQTDIKRSLDSQLSLFCASQADPKKCIRDGLPFTKESYDLVISMVSSNNIIQDLATRAVWDGQSFGDFSRQNKEIFASLSGRQFDVLDCHSNGAMLCLAALRSGETTTKKVRLFGPQINPEAAARWQEWAHETGAVVEIYINNGDPVPAISWKQPTPQTKVGKVATAAWLATPIGGYNTLAGALFNVWQDNQSAIMDQNLRDYGFKVTRFYPKEKCVLTECHSMLLYEEDAGILPRGLTQFPLR